MDARPPIEPPQDLGWRPLRLRYAGVCVVCGIELLKGADALYDTRSKTVKCIECPQPRSAGSEAEVDPGVAGASARREYERRKATRETRVKDRLGKRLGGVVLALTDDPQSTKAWAQGARGEEALAQSLAAVPGVSVLHDRRVRGTRGNIDHLVIGPAGVFVVDAKRYEGLIRIRDRGGLFRSDERLYVGRRDCSELATNMGWQVEAVDAAIRAAAPDLAIAVTPVLCFVDGEWPLLRRPDAYRGVRLEGARSIRTLVTHIEVLAPSLVERLTRILAAAFPPK